MGSSEAAGMLVPAPTADILQKAL